MRNRLKRILSIAICVLLIVGTFATFAADSEDNKTEVLQPEIKISEDYQNKIGLLMKLGILDESYYEMENTVSRKEFAKVLCTLSNLGEPYFDESSTFLDVDPANEYAKYISTAKRLGLISGYSTDVFKPDDVISIIEALVGSVKVLGYDGIARAKGGYPKGYLSVIRDKDLDDNLNADTNRAISKKEVVELCYNALHTEIAKVLSIKDDDSTIFSVSEKTLLNQAFNLKYHKGVVEGIDITKLRGENNIPPYCILIDDIMMSIGSTTPNSLLGYYVEAYYSDKDGKKTLSYICKKVDKNQELEINLEDIYDVENNTISYTDKNGKTKKQAYSGTIAVVFNGASTKKPFTMDLLKDANGTFKKGNIKLLDSKNDGSYDVIFAEVYDECVVGQTMGTNYTVYDYYEPQKTFKLDTSQDDPFVVLNDKNGNEMSFLSLEQFDTLMIYKSLDDAYQERIIVNVSKARMSGTIKAITNKDGKRHITLDDKDVVFSDIYAKYCEGELKVGQSVELSLDINGEAVGVRKIVESNVYRWGYIIGVHEENGLEKSLSAKIMKDDKNIALVQFDKKIKIDGVSFKNDKDKNTKIILWLEKASKAISGVSAERCTAQLLKYKLSNKGTIIEIDTVLNDKGEETKFGEASDNNSVYRRKLTNEYYYSSVDTIGGKTILSNDTKVFVCPSISAINTEYQDEKLYSVMGKSYFINCDQYSLNAFYSLEDTATAEAVIIYGSTGSVGDLPTNAPTYMVAEINEGLDKDGMVAKKVHLTNGSEDITITCPDTVKSDGAPNITVDGLNIGDVILVSKNTYGEMAGFQVLYDRKNDTLLNNNTSFIAYRRVISGYIYDVYKDCLVLAKTTDKALIPSFIQSDGLEFVPKNNFPVVVYDSTMPEDSKKVTSGSIKDVIGYATSVEECSKVVLQYSYGVPLSMMIIK